MRNAGEIFAHHLEAFGAGDLDEILVDYTPDTLMIYGDRIWRGLDGARDFFSLWLSEWIPAGSRFDVIDQHTVDSVVYLTWTAESEKYVFDFGTDTFVMRDGKVLQQTVATKHRLK